MIISGVRCGEVRWDGVAEMVLGEVGQGGVGALDSN